MPAGSDGSESSMGQTPLVPGGSFANHQTEVGKCVSSRFTHHNQQSPKLRTNPLKEIKFSHVA